MHPALRPSDPLRTPRPRALPTLLLGLLLGPLLAHCSAPPRDGGAGSSSGAPPTARGEPQEDGRMAWWREARFGLMLHWGLFSVPGGQWDGATDHAEWIRATARIPAERYREFGDELEGEGFDADDWARLAQRAGMGYLIVNAKHHDGFALWDSAASDFDVMGTPFGRDVLSELAAACARHALRLGFYYSIMDWHHPDYLPRRGWEERGAESADFERYMRFLRAQVTELLTGYGDVGVMWFDGAWESDWTHDRGRALYDLCRQLQPGVIVNDRVDKGGSAGAGGGWAGDFATPEQEAPAPSRLGGRLDDLAWESSITLNRHRGWNAADQDWKSTTELVHALVDVASKGGNLLLHVGPTAGGELPRQAAQRLEALGRWMDVNAIAVLGTRPSPVGTPPWGRCTVGHEDDGVVLYLLVLDWPEDGWLVVPNLGSIPRRAAALGRPGLPLRWKRGEGGIGFDVGALIPRDHCTVIAVEFAHDPVVYEAPRIEARSRIFFRPLEVTLSTRAGELELRYTLDGREPSTRSPVYTEPLVLKRTATVKARSFHLGRPVSATTSAEFEWAKPRRAVHATGLLPGWVLERYEGSWEVLPDFTALTPISREVVFEIGLPPGPGVEGEGRRFTGLLRVPATDVYAFHLTSADGSRLWVGNQLVVDNDGLHGPRAYFGWAVLAEGLHPLRLEYFNDTGGAELDLRWTRLDHQAAPLRGDAMQHEAGDE